MLSVHNSSDIGKYGWKSSFIRGKSSIEIDLIRSARLLRSILLLSFPSDVWFLLLICSCRLLTSDVKVLHVSEQWLGLLRFSHATRSFFFCSETVMQKIVLLTIDISHVSCNEVENPVAFDHVAPVQRFKTADEIISSEFLVRLEHRVFPCWSSLEISIWWLSNARDSELNKDTLFYPHTKGQLTRC